MQKLKSLSEIYSLIEQLPVPNQKIIREAKAYQNQLTKPHGSLGILEDLSIFFCGWQNSIKPSLKKIQTLIFAGNHGVCDQGVNSYPQSVTSEMVLNFKNGGAAINQLCTHSSVNLQVIPIDLDNPTNDIYYGPAMNEKELLVSINIGIKAVNKKSDLIVLGEMGIGNSTIASAISSACFGGSVEKWVGRGTANNDDKLSKKISVIRKSLNVNKNREPLKILMSLGGREQAAIFGAILAARMLKIPVIMDGFICSASVAPLFLLDNSSLDHCIFGHCSMERGHKLLLKSMNKHSLLNLNMHLGEGSGAMVALNVVRSALVCHNGMASFESAGVSNST